LIDAAVSAGVRYVEGDAASLTFNETGGCTGVRLVDGSIATADKIVLSTGAGTAKLLADSCPKKPELQAGDRLTAACVITGIVRLNSQEKKQYIGIPVGVHAMNGIRGTLLSLLVDSALNFML
jgi:sarcosine oxidase/L-pipecolate oxidase